MESIVQHFRKDEQPFIEMAAGWVREVEDTYSPKLTGFLDPRQRYITETLMKGAGLQFTASGGFQDAERQRILLYPDYYEPQMEDFAVTIFEIEYPSRFVTLEHRDILGALMSLGIDRSKFGDIRVDGDRIQMTVANELRDYMTANFTQAGKTRIRLEQTNNLLPMTEVWTEQTYIISSLRLDTVVAALLKCPRQKAAALIHGEKVKVNWTLREQTAFEVNESDMISIRGAGRFKVIAIEGRTKKDKIRLLIGSLE